MEQFPILSLPTEVQGLVVKRVAHNSFEDLYRLRATCKEMRSLGDGEDVYASFDLCKYQWRRLLGYRLHYLLRRCYAQGNPSTLYIKGVKFFYRRDMHAEGLDLLKRAADSGYERASYTYAMTRKLWDDDGDQLRVFSRNYVGKIGLLVRSSVRLWEWDHNDYFHRKRHVFISEVAPIFFSCPCSPLLDGHWALWDFEDRKAEDMCNRCFWIKEVGLFLRDFKASTGHPNFVVW